MSTLPEGTQVRLNIIHDNATITALGIIANSQPHMGMGIRFTAVGLADHEVLAGWLAALAEKVTL